MYYFSKQFNDNSIILIKHLASWENAQTLSLKTLVKQYTAYHSNFNISNIKTYIYI